MRKVTSIGFAIGTLTIIALPVHAEDQSIYYATGAIGGGARPAYAGDQQAQYTWRRYSAVRPAPSLRVSPAAYGGYPYGRYSYGGYPYGGYPYGGYAQSYGYAQRNCTYVGGPKGDWSCW
jgi:hypothetical protein